MEVRIKDNNGYVDAGWTIEDGVMVVSPKVEPKDGDVIYIEADGEHIIIYKEHKDGIGRYVNFSNNKYLYIDIYGIVCNKGDVEVIRPATEEEKKLLFDKLKEEGLTWDAEKKEVVKLEWKPADHEKVYVAGFTFYGKDPFCPFEDAAYANSMQWRAVYERGWYFKTEEECQAFCDRLNDAIKSVKP